MIRRLLEAHYFSHRSEETRPRIRFRLLELRTPMLLIEAAGQSVALCRALRRRRPLLDLALSADEEGLDQALREEERVERLKDRKYWEPLRREPEWMRHGA